MTTDVALPIITHTVAGTGPYSVPWPYGSGELVVRAEQAGKVITLTNPSQWSVSPDSSPDTGVVTLSASAASSLAGAKMTIERDTVQEQGWQGQSAREIGLMAALDRTMRAVQDLKASSRAALRLHGGAGIPPIEPLMQGSTLIWDGEAFISGPNIQQIGDARDAADAAIDAAVRALAAAEALSTAALGGSITFTPSDLAPITLPSAAWIITDLYVSGLPQFAPDDWEQVGNRLTLKRSYHVGQRIDYRYRIAQTLTLASSMLADGSPALPAMGFTNDPDTGLYRIGANILGFAAGGSERMRLTSSGAQISGLLTGTAVTQSSTDATAGRLTKVGDFGLGGTAIPLTGAGLLKDRLLETGFYAYNGGADIPDGPEGTVAWTRTLSVIRLPATIGGGGVDRRVFIDTRANVTGTHRMWVGANSGNGAIIWREFYTAGSVLGAVSQSGGVVTGALRERVSVANGRAERDFSGSMECWRDNLSAPNASTAAGSRFRSADITWTFPSAFLAGSTPVVTASVIDADCDVRLVSVSNTQAVFRVLSDVSKPNALTIRARAKGIWSEMS